MNSATFRALIEHAEYATANLALFDSCRAAIVQNDDLVRCAHDAVWFAVRAFRDAAVLHLFARFDTDPRAISVSAFVRDARLESIDEADRSRDLALLGSKDPLVGKLLQLRHNAVGHTNKNVAEQGRREYIDTFDLSLEELGQLVNRACLLLKKYSEGFLPRQLPADASVAVNELSSVTAYLGDAMVCPTGLERLVPEIDGNVRGSAV